MRYGVCMGIDEPERVKLIKDAGFDYIECGFCNLSRGSDEMFEKFKAALEENGIKCEAANGFFPKDMPIIGERFDKERFVSYITKGFERGKQTGLQTVVFGSGKARALPENVSFADGFNQLGLFLKDTVSPLAEKYGITVAIEPLRKNECNMINSVTEGAALAVLSGRENIADLADIYHMLGAGDTFDSVRFLKGILRHAHISNPNPCIEGYKRTYPKTEEEFDYRGYISSLEYAGCKRCSVEAQTDDFEHDVFLSGAVLKGIG